MTAPKTYQFTAFEFDGPSQDVQMLAIEAYRDTDVVLFYVLRKDDRNHISTASADVSLVDQHPSGRLGFLTAMELGNALRRSVFGSKNAAAFSKAA